MSLPLPRPRCAFLLALTLAACGGGDGPRAEGGGDTAPPPPAVASTDPDCPLTGRWQLCSVRDRLEHAGLAPQPRDSVRPPFLTVPGAVYALGRGELQVFLYPDSAARARDFARIDPLSVQPPDRSAQWSATPTLIASDNMAAVLLSDNATQVERVRLALTAGLPGQ